jgi:hypothetical protein
LAAGAFERNAKEIKDPYTASAVLAAGGASETLRAALSEIIKTAIKKAKDGSQYIEVPRGVVRADGQRPSRVEATALAILALEGDTTAPLADLGATILAGYSPHYGWGDGRANLLCMNAALALFKDPIPDNVAIELAMDGKVISSGTLERAKVRELMVLRADSVGAAGSHSWSVKSVPAVPGLGFSLAVTSWTAWKANPEAKGLELTVDAPKNATVGKAVELTLRAAVPSGNAFEIEVELPAGVQVDTLSLDKLALVELTKYEVNEGTIKMFARPLEPARLFNAKIRVIPTLTGSLQSGPAKLTVNSVEKVTTHVPPVRWTVR